VGRRRDGVTANIWASERVVCSNSREFPIDRKKFPIRSEIIPVYWREDFQQPIEMAGRTSDPDYENRG
jgi:hypothetical protein